MRRILNLLLCAGLLFANSGCQGAGNAERLAVFGTVTSESGVPISGMISFLPEVGTVGPSATASLIDGAFAFDAQNGPVAGTYRVLVVKQAADKKDKGRLPAESEPRPRAAVAGENRPTIDEEWSFAADVSPDDLEFHFEVPDRGIEATSG